MDNSSKNSTNFLLGAAIIAFSHVFVKIIGMLFRLPLANIIGTQGIAVYQTAYSIYTVFFVIATAGLPVAISKMISERRASENLKEVKKIYTISLKVLLLIGSAGTIILIAGAKLFSNSFGYANYYPAIICLAPSLFFVSVSSVYRGYYQGMQNMIPTAVSELFESLFKLICGLSFAVLLLPYGYVIAASGGILGVTTGACISALFLTIYHRINNKKENNKLIILNSERNSIIKELIKIAVPITLGSCVFSMTSVIDTAMVLRRLQSIGYMQEETEIMFGYYSGYAITLFNLPASVIVGLSISIVPAITNALVNKQKEIAGKIISTGIRFTWQLAFPAGIGMAVMAKPILKLLYPSTNFVMPMHSDLPENPIIRLICNNTDATKLLTLLGLAISLVCLTMVTNAILQALDNEWKPVKNMFIGGIIKIICNYILIGIPEINIMGAPISTTLCYLTITVLNLYSINKKINVNYNKMATFVKPAVSVVIMSIGSLYLYSFMHVKYNNFTSTILSVGIAVILYLVTMLLLKGFKREDIELLPKSKFITKILGRCLS